MVSKNGCRGKSGAPYDWFISRKVRESDVTRGNCTVVRAGSRSYRNADYFPAASVGAGETPLAVGAAAGSGSLPPKLTT